MGKCPCWGATLGAGKCPCWGATLVVPALTPDPTKAKGFFVGETGLAGLKRDAVPVVVEAAGGRDTREGGKEMVDGGTSAIAQHRALHSLSLLTT